MATNPINLWNASEADLKSLDDKGQAKFSSTLQLRERKDDFDFDDVAKVTQIEPSKWMTWSKAGVLCITKLFAGNKRYTAHHRASLYPHGDQQKHQTST